MKYIDRLVCQQLCDEPHHSISSIQFYIERSGFHVSIEEIRHSLIFLQRKGRIKSRVYTVGSSTDVVYYLSPKGVEFVKKNLENLVKVTK